MILSLNVFQIQNQYCFYDVVKQVFNNTCVYVRNFTFLVLSIAFDIMCIFYFYELFFNR